MTLIRHLLLCLLGALTLGQAQAQSPTKITLGHTGVADFLAAFVAQEQGFFKKQGLEVTLMQVAGGALVPGLQGDSLQVATLPPTHMLLAVDGGLDMVAIAGGSVSEQSDTNSGLIVAPGSGIQSARDLVGKKIGVPSIGGFLHVMARKWLASQGVDASKVSFVEVNFAQIADLVKSGLIQAGTSADPFLKRSVQAGHATALTYFAAGLPAQTAGIFYGAKRAWVTTHPAAVRGFKLALAEAVAFINANPQAARADMAKYIKLPPEVLATVPIPRLVAEVTEEQMRFWVDTMKAMALTRTPLTPAGLIVR